MPSPRLREINKIGTSVYIQDTVNLCGDMERKDPAYLNIFGDLTLHTSFFFGNIIL